MMSKQDVREATGKTVYMPVPKLRAEECFIELDPARLRKNLARAATIRGADRFGTPVRVGDVKPLDLIVCGAVAVSGQGGRVGKGGGYSDLEFGLLREAGAATPRTPIVTTVHPLQIVPRPIEMLPHDIPWEDLSEEKIAAIPVLGQLRPARAG